MTGNTIDINDREFNEALNYLKRMENSLDPKWIKKTLRKNSKPIVLKMKVNCKGKNLPKMVGVTTARKYAGKFGVRIGAEG